MKTKIRLELISGIGAVIYYMPALKEFVGEAPWFDGVVKHDTIRGVRDSLSAAYQLKIESERLEGQKLFWNSRPSKRDGCPNWSVEDRWWDGTLEKVTREGARSGTFKLVLRSPEHPHPFIIEEGRAYLAGKRSVAKTLNDLDNRVDRYTKARETVIMRHKTFSKAGSDVLLKALPRGDRQKRQNRRNRGLVP